MIVDVDGETFVLSDAGAQGPQGDPGDPGAPGANGTDGATWRNGSGAPSNALGSNGDFYLDDDTGDVYKRSSGTYAVVANIEGPAGADGATGPAGAGATGSLQPSDYGLKAWPFNPDAASRLDTDMEDNYSYVVRLRLSEATSLSKIAVHSGSNTAPTTAKAALYSVSAGVATRQVLANDVRSLFQQFRGRTADLGATYSHDPDVDEHLMVALYVTGGTMPRIARGQLDYMNCRYDDGLAALAPWGDYFSYGRVVGSPPSSFNLADIIFTDRDFWIAVG